MAPYRPPGRSNRSGRSQADNDVFEGLPVKQWTNSVSRISLAPPVSETPGVEGQNRWGEPPMPRDFQMLQPWTQQLLRMARSGKVGQKRKALGELDGEDAEEFVGRDEEAPPEDAASGPVKQSALVEDRAFVARKWRHVPDSALVPEHLHWEFLAKRRKGLPNFYHGLASDVYGGNVGVVSMRKTKVQKVVDTTTGESAIYEVLVPEGQQVENEIRPDSDLNVAETKPLPEGTVVEGLGVANEEGVLVAETARAAVRPRRPQQKKKGGPGRGKKRVTFTNPDGSTYTTIVPNATKIVPQPGQTIKHVAKGEEAARDVSAAEAATFPKDGTEGGSGEGEDDDEDDDSDEDEDDEEGEEGDDHEDGEIEEGVVAPVAPNPDGTPVVKSETITTASIPEPPATTDDDTVMTDLPASGNDATLTETGNPAENLAEQQGAQPSLPAATLAQKSEPRSTDGSSTVPLIEESAHELLASEVKDDVMEDVAKEEPLENKTSGPSAEVAPSEQHEPIVEAVETVEVAEPVKTLETSEPVAVVEAVEPTEVPEIEEPVNDPAIEESVEIVDSVKEPETSEPALEQIEEVRKDELPAESMAGEAATTGGDGDDDLLGNLEKSLEG